MSGSESGSVRAAVLTSFVARHGSTPAWIARAPGRVNLIGEHTDYNDGFVLPMAIDRAVWIALRPRDDGMVSLFSLDFQDSREFALADTTCASSGWMKYVHAMACALGEEASLTGFEGVIMGDVPIGAGLSSSAAIELAAARAFVATSKLAWNARRMAQLAQRAENRWVGVNCGLMDQMISAAGQAGHALLLDCRTLENTPVLIPAGIVVVVLDTGTRRGLVDSEYNDRRMHCEAAAAFLGVPALRDVDSRTLAARAAGMSAVMHQRARHVVTENERTLQAADALAHGDLQRLGALMDASHASLRDDFEVSSKELDGIVEIARRQPGCVGARMTGAGFGGCAVALVESERAAAFAAAVTSECVHAHAWQPSLYICAAADGASIEAGGAGRERGAHAPFRQVGPNGVS